jgi:serine kinase of HPr protein (carbohydrate metabolism regulator)
MNAPVHVHATAVLLGPFGVLVRGASGSGKSLLALSLLDHWQGRGAQSYLVADDQVMISRIGDRLSMTAPEPIAGLIELRFRGLIPRPHRSPVDLNLVVDLVSDPIRLPEPGAFTADLLGLEIARAPVPQGSLLALGHQVLLVNEAVKALR